LSSHNYAPEDPAGKTWEVVVIGTGMGGSTVGHALARRGHEVLFLEKGMFLFGDHDRGDGRCTSSEHFGEEGMFVKRRFMVLA